MPRVLLWLQVVGKLGALAAWGSGLPLGIIAVLCIGPDLVLFYHLFVPGAQGLGRVHTRFDPGGRREVWLTIDDGPCATDTPRLLALLAAHGARATFFVVGERAARWPEGVRAIRDAGHEIGHHTHTHPELSFWCARPGRGGRLEAELDQTLAVLAAAGVRPTRFRAPVGIKNPFLFPALRRRGLACVGWSLRSWDSVSRDPARSVRRVVSRVGPGDIVLLHEGPRLAPAVRVHLLAALLPALAQQGYRCVVPTADQLR